MMLELPHVLHDIHIMKPSGHVSYVPQEEFDPLQPETGKMEFRFVKSLDSNYYLYEFVSES